MVKKQIQYFSHSGVQNTQDVLNTVKEKIQELGIKYVVIASSSGITGLNLWTELQNSDCKLISVTEHSGFYGKDATALTEKRKNEMESKGIKVLTASHSFSGIGRSISKKIGGVNQLEIIAQTLRLFSEGIKVAVEISIMAADSGLVPTYEEIIAIGGSGSGADSAIVLKAAHMNNFFDLEIREIIAKPRQRL
ncbi:MAG: hypothetical protein HN952_06405 [Candidatus Cloacimonetes bacterium]|nr:hypothetical protein [Candidatus Cloacimonadota bacterium]MBT6994566.1 hypothetical protein [Candidatus Cloacimonadota bacterium]